tara:strand:+ start:182 stop:547 length:366 start_codon:yes stop_codon:yes gene_type:complete
MALNKGSLGFGTQIGPGGNAHVLVVDSSEPVYVKSILVHSLDVNNIQNVAIHYIQNNAGSPGTATSTNRIARLGITTSDTFFFEPAYPITLTSNGDSIYVANEGITSDSINVVVLGDKEVA